MIASFTHDSIFIKLEKTAGTSNELALSSFCGRPDIITPTDLDDEKVRQAKGQRHLYTSEGKPVLDDVIRYEDLPGAFNSALAKSGLRFDGDLPHAETSQRADRDLLEIFSGSDIGRVARQADAGEQVTLHAQISGNSRNIRDPRISYCPTSGMESGADIEQTTQPSDQPA